jgi:hypothetical protein
VFAAQSGSPMQPSTFQSAVPLPASYAQETTRITAYGFEVLNTTSDLNVQGSVIAFEQQMPDITSTCVYTFIDTAPANQIFSGGIQVMQMPAWPQTATQALQLTRSREWLARDGGYCVLTMNGTNPPCNNNQAVAPLIYLQTPGDTIQYTGFPTYTGLVNGTASVNVVSTSPCFLTNFNMKGLYFQGLSLGTTLTLNVRYSAEQFPTQASGLLESLATPSPPLDTAALELYSRIMRDIPAGVPQFENGLGDFFSGLWEKAKEVVAPIGKMVGSVMQQIPIPKIQAIGATISGVSNVLVPVDNDRNAPTEPNLRPADDLRRGRMPMRGVAQAVTMTHQVAQPRGRSRSRSAKPARRSSKKSSRQTKSSRRSSSNKNRRR